MKDKQKALILNIVLACLILLFIIFSVRIDSIFPQPMTGLSADDIPEQKAFINTSSGTNPGAPIELIEFSDFSCVFSRQSYLEVKQILNESGENINFVFKHFPQDNLHANAFDAAIASECARDQDKFMEYHDALFEYESMDGYTFKSIAEALGLDISEFDSCIESGDKAKIIMSDMREAQQNNIIGTPVFIINGDMIIGSQDYDSLKSAIDKQLDPETIVEGIMGRTT